MQNTERGNYLDEIDEQIDEAYAAYDTQRKQKMKALKASVGIATSRGHIMTQTGVGADDDLHGELPEEVRPLRTPDSPSSSVAYPALALARSPLSGSAHAAVVCCLFC